MRTMPDTEWYSSVAYGQACRSIMLLDQKVTLTFIEPACDSESNDA